MEAAYGIVDAAKTAIIEMSAAAGITLLDEKERNPLDTTTFGVGELICDAIAKGCRNFIVGIGGSATNDGGIGMLNALGYVRFIRVYSKTAWLSLFLLIAMGYYITSLSMLRQSLAIVCVLNSIQYVENRNFRKFALCVLIAVCFHYTAIAFFLLYPLSRFKISIGYFICLLAFAFLLSVFAGKFVLLQLIEKYYSIYEGKMESEGGYSMLLLLLAITFGGLLVRQYNHIADRRFDVFCQMLIVACCLQLFSLQFSLFARVVLYYQIAIVVFIPEVLSFIKDRYLAFFCKMGVVMGAVSFFIWIYLANNSSGILPYAFLWNIICRIY